MKTSRIIPLVLAFFVCAGLFTARAQTAMSGPLHGPSMSGSFAKIFPKNAAFSATLEIAAKPATGDAITVTGKIQADGPKTRFEFQMADVKNPAMTPQIVEMAKSMGMASITVISRPDKQSSMIVYPGLRCYFATNDTGLDEGWNKEETELVKETVDGHPCVKYDTVISDTRNNVDKAIVWKATDLHEFPIKIEETKDGTVTTMLFKDLKLGKPDATLFEPPADFTRYEDMTKMMMDVVAKKMGH